MISVAIVATDIIYMFFKTKNIEIHTIKDMCYYGVYLC
jgi:hypothetical protein